MRKLAIYPGAFDPMTNGHIDIAKRALSLFDQVIIAVATNSKKQSLFSIEERLDLIHRVIKDLGIDKDRLEVATFSGLTVDFCEERGASAIIRGLRAVTDFDYEYAISLMNKKLAPDLEPLPTETAHQNPASHCAGWTTRPFFPRRLRHCSRSDGGRSAS